MNIMPLSRMTNAELIRHVDNDPNATPMERELAQRMDELQVEITLISRETESVYD